MKFTKLDFIFMIIFLILGIYMSIKDVIKVENLEQQIITLQKQIEIQNENCK